jgi:hypothetical protein
MQKMYLAKLLLGAALSTLVPQFVFASDMGNGPAGLAVWLVGTVIALIIAFISSCNRDELEAFHGFKLKKFFVVFVVLMPVVFIIGVVAIFI